MCSPPPPSASRVWALPHGPHVAGSFRDVDAELADVLPDASLRQPGWALLRRPHLVTSFRDLDAELADVLPVAALRLSHDVAGHLELLRAHCRQRAAAQYHDPDEAALHDRHLASLYQFELEHPPDPTLLKSLLSSIVGRTSRRSCWRRLMRTRKTRLSECASARTRRCRARGGGAG
ncbi:hypothetical protein QYE76_057629 [Lolium multiflorum]|uniref:Uncharacterized protein n=1 Tax=Lolium multiflorum TaxID=4521 RepID=A0AAD8T4T0_LOLMU|nr:hypothetical protein QYE76_057629 [Lolium multiflorum]